MFLFYITSEESMSNAELSHNWIGTEVHYFQIS